MGIMATLFLTKTNQLLLSMIVSPVFKSTRTKTTTITTTTTTTTTIKTIKTKTRIWKLRRSANKRTKWQPSAKQVLVLTSGSITTPIRRVASTSTTFYQTWKEQQERSLQEAPPAAAPACPQTEPRPCALSSLH